MSTFELVDLCYPSLSSVGSMLFLLWEMAKDSNYIYIYISLTTIGPISAVTSQREKQLSATQQPVSILGNV